MDRDLCSESYFVYKGQQFGPQIGKTRIHDGMQVFDFENVNANDREVRTEATLEVETVGYATRADTRA